MTVDVNLGECCCDAGLVSGKHQQLQHIACAWRRSDLCFLLSPYSEFGANYLAVAGVDQVVAAGALTPFLKV
jgi:hypothetical protein